VFQFEILQCYIIYSTQEGSVSNLQIRSRIWFRVVLCNNDKCSVMNVQCFLWQDILCFSVLHGIPIDCAYSLESKLLPA
jgi:hypothetical protein